MYRAVLIDPSAVCRKWVTQALIQSGAFEVVAAVATVNGAFAKCKGDPVQAAIFELSHLPGVVGSFETMIQSLQQGLGASVVLCAFSEQAEALTELRRAGLVSPGIVIVEKPKPLREVEVVQIAQREICGRLRELIEMRRSQVHVPSQTPMGRRPFATGAISLAPRRVPPFPQVRLVAIGASTGGPEALSKIVADFPARLGVPVVITQHMPETMTAWLAQSLSARSKLPVQEAQDGEALQSDTIYLAPGGKHLLFRRTNDALFAVLDSGPKEHACRPAVDPMMRSAARVCGSGVLAVMLTGMGYDGLEGCKEIFEAGGQVIAQDEASSVVWGMPGVVARAGIAEDVMPLLAISKEITDRLAGRRSPRITLHKVSGDE